MHPAADVVSSQLLGEVAEDNRRLKEETGRLHDSRDFLGGIELRLGGSRVISSSLGRGYVVNDFGGIPCVCVPLDADPMPLSCFRSGKASLAGQSFGNSPGFCCVSISIADNESVRLRMAFSERIKVEGEISCLDKEDLARFKDGTYGEDVMLDCLTTGRGRLRNPDAILFEAHMMVAIISDDLRDTIHVLGPLPTFANGTTLKRREPLPVEPGVDCVECPPPSTCDESRLNLAEALGCDDSQLFEENRKLKILRHQLSKVEERIGSVELYHDLQRTSLSFEDGEYVEYPNEGKKWRISLEADGKYPPIVANNLNWLEISISGVRSDLNSMHIRIRRVTGLRTFRGTFGNGANIIGYFDMQSAPEMMDDALFLDRAHGFANGEPFPPSLTLRAKYLTIPLEYADKVWEVLGGY